MNKLYWKLKVILLSLRWVTKLNLGDYVWYNNKKCMLVQGVCSPSWDLMYKDERINYIHESNFKKVKSISNYWHSFNSGYRFYMSNWCDIWVNEGIKPWMLGCKIWGK